LRAEEGTSCKGLIREAPCTTGATVVMLNRPSARATAAAARVGAAAGGGEVLAVECDLADFASVRWGGAGAG